MRDVLCPALYNRLVQLFGDVIVASEGEGYREVRLVSMGQSRRQVITTGEYYRVNCPFCTDTRKRLYINHRYAHRNGMAICFNDKACLTGEHNYVNREKLRQTILNFVNPGVHFDVKPSKVEADDGGPLPVVGYPGKGRLMNLVERDHPAYQYLVSRRFDPDKLAREFGVGLVDSVDDVKLTNVVGRILVPIHMHGQMVGWQGRYPDDIDWKATGIRKYWNLPQMKKSRMLYGYDQARTFPYCVVVEGVTDVWRVGSPAICILGSSLNFSQRRLICTTWNTVLVMLDPDALDRSRIAVLELKNQLKDVGGRVVEIDLPKGKDPADFDSRDVQWTIAEASEKAGLTCV